MKYQALELVVTEWTKILGTAVFGASLVKIWYKSTEVIKSYILLFPQCFLLWLSFIKTSMNYSNTLHIMVTLLWDSNREDNSAGIFVFCMVVRLFQSIVNTITSLNKRCSNKKLQHFSEFHSNMFLATIGQFHVEERTK